jgi:ubiquitin carboxyl-terminal hydrolase 9/24
MKVSQRNWAEVFGEGNMFAISPVSTFQKVNVILFHLFDP